MTPQPRHPATPPRQCKCAQGEESELEQVEHELSDLNKNKGSTGGLKDKEREGERKSRATAVMACVGMVFSQIFLKSFTLTFVAEWGDRSQIATIGWVPGGCGG